MKCLLLLPFAFAVSSVWGQDSLPGARKLFRVEIIPVICELTYVHSNPLGQQPYNAQYIYDSHRNWICSEEILCPRLVIKDWVVLGARLSTQNVKLKKHMAFEQLQAAYPHYHLQEESIMDRYQLFGAVLFGGIHLRMGKQMSAEVLLDYRFTDIRMPYNHYAFKDNASNSYYINEYYTDPRMVRTFTYECNLIRRSRTWQYFFYGVNLAYMRNRLNRAGFVEQTNFSGPVTTIEYDFSKTMHSFSFGIFLGFRIPPRSFFT